MLNEDSEARQAYQKLTDGDLLYVSKNAHQLPSFEQDALRDVLKSRGILDGLSADTGKSNKLADESVAKPRTRWYKFVNSTRRRDIFARDFIIYLLVTGAYCFVLIGFASYRGGDVYGITYDLTGGTLKGSLVLALITSAIRFRAKTVLFIALAAFPCVVLTLFLFGKLN